MDGRMKPVLILACLGWVCSLACSFGRVDQGRAVAYDKERGVVTVIIQAVGPHAAATPYVLPAVQVRIPRDPKEMGPAPETGRLLLLDTKSRCVIVFDPDSA